MNRLAPYMAALFVCLAWSGAVRAERVELFSHSWEAGPASIYPGALVKEEANVRLPPACENMYVLYEVHGEEQQQYAVCRFQVFYESGGGSEAVVETVAGLAERQGSVPSVLAEPDRRIKVVCEAADRDCPMRVAVRAWCERSLETDMEFQEGLEKFLETN